MVPPTPFASYGQDTLRVSATGTIDPTGTKYNRFPPQLTPHLYNFPQQRLN